MYPSSDIADVPKKPGIYVLIQRIIRSSAHPYQYVGHAGDLKKRLKQHLVEDTGTTNSTKKAVHLQMNRLTNFGIIPTDQVSWPENVERPLKRKNETEGEYIGRCSKIIAEAAEEICKNHESYSPVFHDRSKPKTTPQLLINDKEFKQEINSLLVNGFREFDLSTFPGLSLQVHKLKQENKNLKQKILRLERELKLLHKKPN